MSKLTLSVDDDVVSRAKRYAQQHGTSISQMVETYLAAISDPPAAPAQRLPVLRSVRGILKKGNLEGYRKYLAGKYR